MPFSFLPIGFILSLFGTKPLILRLSLPKSLNKIINYIEQIF